MTTLPDLHGAMSESRLAALDVLLNGQAPERWNSFFSDRAKTCVFFGSEPDESLAEWVGDLTLAPGRAIDLGCGNGRNAIFLAARGFDVDAVDHSAAAIAWARERAFEAQVDVAWHCRSIFEPGFPIGAHDLVVDSGCFHHIAPHRRQTYLATIASALRPGGWFGLTCFRPEGGSGLSDAEVYERRSLGGGLGYTDGQLRSIFGPVFRVHALRTMREQAPDTGLFGQPFLWAMLAQKA